MPFEEYEVIERVPVDAGIAGYSFGGGGGIQFEFLQSIQDLIDQGILKVVGR